ncbi:MAG: glycosyltransferase [Bacilli bacterium]|jgi:glycosyltransferase involved in cell wall biosynthesis|nr:glycosyltransferase [Bacilli bacterium]
MKKPNICFVNQSMGIGGSSKLLFDIISTIDRTKYDVSLVIFFPIIDDQYSQLLHMSNLKVYLLHKKRTIDFAFFSELKKTIKMINPDVISSHLTCIFYLNLFVNFRKVKVFHTIHNKPNADLPWIYRFFLHRNITNGKIHLIGCSEEVAREASVFYKVPVVGIMNGVKLRSPSSISIPKKYDFVCVGRFSIIKRFDDLVEAFFLVKQKVPSATLCICGYGPERKRIISKIEKLSLSSSVFVFGPDKNVNELYSESKIFCLFSSREGAPITILEAMNFGLPIIATNVNGVRDFVHDGKNGFLFECQDVEKGALLMNKVLSDPSLYLRMSENSSKIIKNFSIQSTTERYLKVFGFL